MLEILKRLSGRAAAPVAEPVAQPVAEAVPPANADNVELSTLADTSLSGWFRQESNELFEGFPICAEDSVLDIGCGDGPFVQFCAHRGAEVIFADIDADKVAAVERALQGSPARAMTPLVTDANPIPLPDGRVSKIVAMEVLEHVEDPRQFMSELVRVGRPGAQYLITVPDPLGESVQKDLAPPAYFEHPNHIRVFQRDEFERLIEEAGLVIERKAQYGFYWSVWWFFFWACKQDLSPPWHPLLDSWTRTWNMLLSMEDGPRIKQALDRAMPKSQAIIARKPV
ncbi:MULTISPECIES: bifunctional 2-polyprenyl-6-hydroxyphenol methylase/3-demethylubiquinol 3-O-methyltransferase UbiG [Pseudomonas]|uniref:class I SAM-dependent methyltransferase n=1 Tax=Pseudomonadaceae TaxID=135621 RepID=UPI0010F9841E|nr:MULTISPECIES: class I SAM-dependent methyltransferase [Pseudomonas]MDE3738253.1 class I SAM-dependent methyltransferase [Pseudomonas resinovorans]